MQAHHSLRTEIMVEPKQRRQPAALLTRLARTSWRLMLGCVVPILLVGIVVLIHAPWSSPGGASGHAGTRAGLGSVFTWLRSNVGAGFLPQDAGKTWKPGDPGHIYRGQWLPNTPWGFHPGGPSGEPSLEQSGRLPPAVARERAGYTMHPTSWLAS
jgi:hypothetical protein